MVEEPPAGPEDADGGNLNTVDDGVLGLRRGGGGASVGVVTLSDGLRGGV